MFHFNTKTQLLITFQYVCSLFSRLLLIVLWPSAKFIVYM